MEEPIEEGASPSVLVLVLIAMGLVVAALVFLRIQTRSDSTSPLAAEAGAPTATEVPDGAPVPDEIVTPSVEEAQQELVERLATCPQGQVPQGDGCVPLTIGGFNEQDAAASDGALDEAGNADGGSVAGQPGEDGPGPGEAGTGGDTVAEEDPAGLPDAGPGDAGNGDDGGAAAEPTTTPDPVEEPLAVRLDGQLRRVDGVPLDFATVYLTDELFADVGQDGSFSLEAIGGTYGVIVDVMSAEGSTGLVFEAAPMVLSGAVNLDVVIASPSQLTVTVLTADGLPADGAEVTMLGQVGDGIVLSGLDVLDALSTSNNGWFAFAASDPAGLAVLSVYPGSNSIEVQFDGADPQVFAWDGSTPNLTVSLR